jgi:MFS family permease
MESAFTAKYNARLAVISNFLSDLTFILPIWLLYSLDVLRLTPTLAVTIFMTIWIGSALLEVPTGALADRIGRKKVFIVGQALFCLYPLGYAFEAPAALLACVCLISALGSAMRSGALLPIVHASYKKAGFSEHAYDRFLSTNHTFSFIARALTGITGAWLYTAKPAYPFLAMFFVTFLNVLLGLMVADTKVEGNEGVTNWQHMRRTLAHVKRSELVWTAIVTFGLLDVTAEAVWTGYSVFFQADGRSPVVIGTLFTVISLCSALSAYLVRFISGKVSPFRLLQGFGLSVALTAVLLAQPNITLRLGAVLPMAFGSGIFMFVLNSLIQKRIANQFHSTALSLINFVQYAVYGIGSLAFGALLQLFGSPASRSILLVSSLVALVAAGVYARPSKEVIKA